MRYDFPYLQWDSIPEKNLSKMTLLKVLVEVWTGFLLSLFSPQNFKSCCFSYLFECKNLNFIPGRDWELFCSYWDSIPEWISLFFENLLFSTAVNWLFFRFFAFFRLHAWPRFPVKCQKCKNFSGLHWGISGSLLRFFLNSTVEYADSRKWVRFHDFWKSCLFSRSCSNGLWAFYPRTFFVHFFVLNPTFFTQQPSLCNATHLRLSQLKSRV